MLTIIGRAIVSRKQTLATFRSDNLQATLFSVHDVIVKMIQAQKETTEVRCNAYDALCSLSGVLCIPQSTAAADVCAGIRDDKTDVRARACVFATSYVESAKDVESFSKVVLPELCKSLNDASNENEKDALVVALLALAHRSKKHFSENYREIANGLKKVISEDEATKTYAVLRAKAMGCLALLGILHFFSPSASFSHLPFNFDL